MKLILKHTVVIACLLPLLFFNIKDTHDWGDDFAQYLTEAQNILNHQPVNNTTFTKNPNYVLGPNFYPPGFPLIIASTAFFTHLDVKKLNILISFFLLLCAYFSFVIFQTRFSFLNALLLSLCFVYNPLCLNLKTEILSDIPFTAFVLLFFILYQTNKERTVIYFSAGVIMSFAVSIRYVGWVLFASFICHFILLFLLNFFIHKKTYKSFFKKQLYVLTGFVIGEILLYILFPEKTVYYNNPKALPVFENIFYNLTYNYEILKYFFSCFDKGVLNYIIPYTIIVFSLGGMCFIVWYKKYRAYLIFVLFTLFYIGSLLIHPFSNTGVRLLLPIIPLFLFFSFLFFEHLTNNLIYKNAISALLCILLIWCYKTESLNVLTNKQAIEGPYSKEAIEVFSFIKQNTSDNSKILFAKPRALAYFTGRTSFINTEWANKELLQKEINLFKPDYALIKSNLSDDSIKNYFSEQQNSHVHLVYESETFKLLKLP